MFRALITALLCLFCSAGGNIDALQFGANVLGTFARVIRGGKSNYAAIRLAMEPFMRTAATSLRVRFNGKVSASGIAVASAAPGVGRPTAKRHGRRMPSQNVLKNKVCHKCKLMHETGPCRLQQRPGVAARKVAASYAAHQHKVVLAAKKVTAARDLVAQKNARAGASAAPAAKNGGAPAAKNGGAPAAKNGAPAAKTGAPAATATTAHATTAATATASAAAAAAAVAAGAVTDASRKSSRPPCRKRPLSSPSPSPSPKRAAGSRDASGALILQAQSQRS